MTLRRDFEEAQICIECGHKFGVWFAANPLWNRVIPGRVGMLCPCCFIVRAEKAGVECTGWQLVPENLQTETSTVKHWWIARLDGWAVRFVRAESPCWKGELQIGPFLIGWQR